MISPEDVMVLIMCGDIDDDIDDDYFIDYLTDNETHNLNEMKAEKPSSELSDEF